SSLGRHDAPLHRYRCSRAGRHHRFVVARQRGVGDHLQVGEATAIVDFEEGKSLRVPLGAHPTLHPNLAGRCFASENIDDPAAHHAFSIETAGRFSTGFATIRLKAELRTRLMFGVPASAGQTGFNSGAGPRERGGESLPVRPRWAEGW